MRDLFCSSSYSQKQIDRLSALEKNHFWHAPRCRLILRLLKTYEAGKHVLDIGCGTGCLVRVLKEEGYLPLGVDPAAPLGMRARAEQLPFSDGKFDAAILADVLEHIQDENEALQEAFRCLRPGGILLLTVPAFRWLWSQRDVEAGHLRRYRARQIRNISKGFGGKLLYLGYYQCLLFPFLIASRLFRVNPKTEEHLPAWLNTVFRRINEIETGLGRWVRWPIGSSLIAVMQKPHRDQYGQ